MILYCDTSALIKRYVEEDGTDEVDILWRNALYISTSAVAFAETSAAFGRKLREGTLTEFEYAAAIKAFKADLYSIIIVPITPALNKTIERLVIRHPLRGFDSIHLGSALLLNNRNKTAQFACFDRQLNHYAAKEGLRLAIKN